mgnify:CR=1 FL=1
MNENDESWDSEKSTRELFDPDNMAEWLKYTPEEFIGVMVLELRQANVSVREVSKLLNANSQLKSIIIDPDGQRVPVVFFMEGILRATRITDRLLDVMRAYQKQRTKKE